MSTAKSDAMRNDSPLRVWGVGTTRTIRVHWMLAELGLDYETREIIPRTDTMEGPDFLQVSARGKVPILEHGSVVIGESAAIVHYLADRFPSDLVFVPTPGTAERARFDEMCFFAMSEMDAPLYVIRRHEGLPEVYGASQVAVDAAREYFLRQSRVVESWLEAIDTFMMGKRFSAVDILIVSCLNWAQFVGIELAPRLADYLAMTAERPASKAAFAKNFPPAAMAMLTKS
ncbi:MAG: glutathione S-transferase [Myxococcota bacterium]|jgi:glutathione S-transferase